MNHIHSLIVGIVCLICVISCAEFPKERVLELSPADFTWIPGNIPRNEIYKQNEGKVVEVHGEITRILNKGGTPTIRINDKILCALSDEYVNKIKSYVVGQQVTVRGIVQFVPNPNEFDAYLSPSIIVGK